RLSAHGADARCRPFLIEGLRAWPWFQEMCRRDPGPGGFADSYDCKKCKMNTPQIIRMSRGCGYEPRADRVHLTVWQPPTGKNGYSGPVMTTCPGFTANLPQVTEVALARVHWSKGNVSVLNPTE